MKKLTLFLLAALCLSAQAFGQAAYSGTLPALTTETITGRTVIVPAPLASITVYAAGTTNKSLVCTDATGGSCASTAPSNPFTADSQGNFGFYIAAGAYDYTITPVSGTVQGPYRINLPLGITLPSTISLGSTVIAIANGGHGQTTKAAGFDALSPNTTRGDLTVRGASNNVRLGLGATGTAPVSDGTDLGYVDIATQAELNAYKDLSATFTNKTIDTGGTNTLKVNGNTLAASAGTATVTLPNSTDQLVGRTTTDTLTNKTLTSPTINTPSISSPTISGTASLASATFSGTVASYNGASTVDHGLPADVALVDATAQNAAITTTTLFAVATAGQYLLEWNAKVTTAAGTSSTLGALTIVYTDPDGVAITVTAPAFISAGTVATTSAGNTTSAVLLGAPLMLNCKAATNITYAFAYASNAANAMNYNLHLRLLAH